MAERLRDASAELKPWDDRVEHAVFQQKLRSLKAFGEFLPDGLLDDARPRKSDERARLGEVHIAEESKTCGDAPRRRIAQIRDERNARFAEEADGAHALGHLHEREGALLHPGAPRGRKNDERTLGFGSALHGPREFFTDHRSHRSAEKLKTKDDEFDRPSFEFPFAREQRIVGAAFADGLSDALGIGLLIDKAQGIGSAELRVVFDECSRIDKELDPALRRERIVMGAGGTDLKIPGKILGLERHAAAIAAAKEPFCEGSFFAISLRDFFLRHPAHAPSWQRVSARRHLLAALSARCTGGARPHMHTRIHAPNPSALPSSPHRGSLATIPES